MGNEIVINLDHLSYSGISAYLQCPKKYEFGYIKGIKAPSSVDMIEGSAHHKVLELNNKNKIVTGVDFSAGKALELFREIYGDKLAKGMKEEGVIYSGESDKEIFNRAEKWYKKYFAPLDFAGVIYVHEVEKQIENVLVFPDFSVKLMGIIDLIYSIGKTGTKIITDYKFCSKKSFANKKKDIADNLQLTLYALLAGEFGDSSTVAVSNICFVKDKPYDIEVLAEYRTKQQVEWAKEIVYKVADGIRKGSFPPTDPCNWACSEKWCGYWHLCRGKIENGK